MTETPPEQTETISQEEVAAAESSEQAQLNASQNAYLLKRVVLLRVRNNRLQKQLDEALAELESIRQQPEPGSDDVAP